MRCGGVKQLASQSVNQLWYIYREFNIRKKASAGSRVPGLEDILCILSGRTASQTSLNGVWRLYETDRVSRSEISWKLQLRPLEAPSVFTADVAGISEQWVALYSWQVVRKGKHLCFLVDQQNANVLQPAEYGTWVPPQNAERYYAEELSLTASVRQL